MYDDPDRIADGRESAGPHRHTKMNAFRAWSLDIVPENTKRRSRVFSEYGRYFAGTGLKGIFK